MRKVERLTRMRTAVEEGDLVKISGFSFDPYSDATTHRFRRFYYNHKAVVGTVQQDGFIKVWFWDIDGRFWFDGRFARIVVIKKALCS